MGKEKQKKAAPAAPRERGPSLHDRLVEVEGRLLGVENRLGIDHAAIAADTAASTAAGVLAAPLSELPAEEEAE